MEYFKASIPLETLSELEYQEITYLNQYACNSSASDTK